MKTKSRILAIVVALLALLTGCSGYSAEPDQAGVHVDGYWVLRTDKKFLNCFGIGGDTPSSGYDGPGNDHYVYPKGQRTYKFEGNSEAEAAALGADSPAIKVVKDNITLSLQGTVTFYLNTDCPVLERFHTEIGIKEWGPEKIPAWVSNGGEVNSSGWLAMLDVYIQQPLKRAATDALLNDDMSYLDLYNGKGRAEFEQKIQEDLPGSVQSLAGGPYFRNFTVQIQKPDIPATVVEALTTKEVAKAENEAQVIKNQTVTTQLVSIKDLVAVLGVDGYIAYQQNELTGKQLELLKQAIDQGKIQILPVPQGTGVSLPMQVPVG